MADGVVEALSLTKTYGAFAAVKDLSFSVAQGEVVGLLGLNGAGKTTTLRLLCGLMHPTAGAVRIAGRDMADEPEATRQQIGFLPETPPIYAEMTVRGFLAFAARLRGMKGPLAATLDAALSATDLLGHQNMPINALSYGTQRRVGMAQAIVHKPALVLLDEPTFGLDPVQVVHMRQLIRSLRRRHTVIVSSHILSEISQLCDRILVLEQGELAAHGTEAELSERVSTQVSVALELEGSVEATRACLESLDFVANHTIEDVSGQQLRVLAELTFDRRSELARALIGAKLGLISMGRAQLALESIFLRLMGEHAGGRSTLSDASSASPKVE